jgi:hypothetical protein
MGISKLEFVEAVAQTFGSYHITPKDLGITSRQVHYWKQSIGLPYFQDEKHLKMNLYQALWLEILHSLSKMGVSTKQLDALSRKVWLEPIEMGYYRNLVLAEIQHPSGSISEKDYYHRILEDPRLMDAMAQEINPFTVGIGQMVKTPMSLFQFNYFPQSDYWCFSGAIADPKEEGVQRMTREPYVAIPLARLFSDLVSMEIIKSEGCTELMDAELVDALNLIYQKKPRYVIAATKGHHQEFQFVYHDTRTLSELISFLKSNDLKKGSRVLLTLQGDKWDTQIIVKAK